MASAVRRQALTLWSSVMFSYTSAVSATRHASTACRRARREAAKWGARAATMAAASARASPPLTVFSLVPAAVAIVAASCQPARNGAGAGQRRHASERDAVAALTARHAGTNIPQVPRDSSQRHGARHAARDAAAPVCRLCRRWRQWRRRGQRRGWQRWLAAVAAAAVATATVAVYTTKVPATHYSRRCRCHSARCRRRAAIRSH